MPTRDALDPDKIKAHLKTKRIGKEVVVFSSTSSTNDIAAEYARNKKNDGLVILAEQQTAGRGRGGNKWFSSAGDSIICSIVLAECDLPPELLSLACAVAVAEAIGKVGKTCAQIKWPNDIILNGRKAGGILLESKRCKGHQAHIIGIGINCHQKPDDFPAEVRPIATSIDIEMGTGVDRISLTRRLLASVEHWLEVAQQDNRKVIDHWKRLSTQLNQRVALVHNRRKYAGHCIGIDPDKGLILQLDSGAVRMFAAAHSTIVR